MTTDLKGWALSTVTVLIVAMITMSAGIWLVFKLIHFPDPMSGCGIIVIKDLPTKAQTDAFCQQKGYRWGTVDTLLCGNRIKCFKTGIDGGLITDCLEAK
jgi:hypothetical protein